MKLAFSTLACPDWSWRRAVDAALDWGYDGIEWRLVDGEMVTPSTPIETVVAIGEAMAANGLGVPALDTSVELAVPPGPERDRAVSDARSMLALGAALGASAIRVFAGAYDDAVADDDAVGWMREALLALQEDAAAHRVRVAVELHSLSGDGGPRRTGLTCSGFLAQVLDALPSDHVGIQWDVGNAVKEGESVADTWSNVGTHLIYLQLKDLVHDPAEGWRFVPAGTGQVPLTEILDLIAGSGFAGWLSYEWEKWWFPNLAGPESALPQFVRYMSAYAQRAR